MNQTHQVAFYLVLSSIGAMVLVGIVLQPPVSSALPMVPDKVGVASMFMFLCFLGISFGLRPNWLKGKISKNKVNKTDQPQMSKRCFLGHHPDCPVFDTHRIKGAKKTWCAGCLGLLLGCLISMILMALYIVISYQQSIMLSRLLFSSGLLLVVLAYGELILRIRSPALHTFLNILLIVGFFFVTESIVELSGNGVYGFFALIICVLWLDTRIQLSRWHHSLLCKRCEHPCKMYDASF